jgi:CubicO group peptidase (beta-lactamase class C family)
MDQFIGKEIFEPLGITDFGWSLDKAGNPHGMSGLQIRAIDMAKIGQMMLDEGSWNGKPILSKNWVRQSVEPGQTLVSTCGLLWWLKRGPERLVVDDQFVTHFKVRGMTEQSLAKLTALKGKPFEMGFIRFSRAPNWKELANGTWSNLMGRSPKHRDLAPKGL